MAAHRQASGVEHRSAGGPGRDDTIDSDEMLNLPDWGNRYTLLIYLDDGAGGDTHPLARCYTNPYSYIRRERAGIESEPWRVCKNSERWRSRAAAERVLMY